MKTTAVISGSFDPITTGHTNLIERALEIFPSVIIAVSHNSEKKYMFDLDTRFKAVEAAISSYENVSAIILEGLLADYVKSVNGVLVKGARSGVDFDYEHSLYEINKSLSGVDSIIFPACGSLQFVSSTFVRELVKYNKSLCGYVPEKSIEVLMK